MAQSQAALEVLAIVAYEQPGGQSNSSYSDKDRTLVKSRSFIGKIDSMSAEPQ